MSDLSNKELGTIIAIGIITTLFTSVIVLETNKTFSIGFATYQNATTNVNISSTLSINLISNAITFGSGTVNNGYNYCWIAKDGDVAGYIDFYDNYSSYSSINCTSANPFTASGQIKLENTGNVNANITVKTSKNASSFIGGNSPELRYGYDDSYDANCIGNHPNGLADITNVNQLNVLSTTKSLFCDKLKYVNGNDYASLQFVIKIPSDAVGYKDNVITFEASQSN